MSADPSDAVILEGEDLTEEDISNLRRLLENMSVNRDRDRISIVNRRTVFAGSVDFSNLTFYGATSFEDAIFTQQATFAGCTFLTSATFARCKFDQQVWFTGCTFRGAADFRQATLSGLAEFSNCRFEHSLDLSSAKALGECHFVDTTFPETIDLSSTTFASGLVIQVKSLDLSDCRLDSGGVIELSGAVIARGLVVRGSPLVISPIETAKGKSPNVADLRGAVLVEPLVIDAGVDLRNCSLKHIANLANLSVPSSSIDSRKHRSIIADDQQPDRQQSGLLEEQYRALRIGAEREGDHASANRYFYEEMHHRQRALGYSARDLVERFILGLYWLVSGYGLRAWRALVSFAAIIVVASVLVYTTGPFDPDCDQDGKCPVLGLRETIQFMTRASVSFTREPGNHLEFWEGWVQLFVRFTGPATLGLALLAIRARVRR